MKISVTHRLLHSICAPNRTSAFRAFVCVAATLLSLAGLGCGGSGGGSASLVTLGGTVSGLAGSGLVLQNNGSNDSPVTANGSFVLTSPVSRGSAYSITVLTQPSNPAQTCSVTGGTGTTTGNVTSIQVTCSTIAYTIGGTVSGLAGTGLVLQNNGGNNTSITANGAFSFSTPVNLGDPFTVTVLTQPSNPAQTCSVEFGTGTATGSSNSTQVQVSCSETIGGTLTGLTGTGLVLENVGADSLSLSTNGPFTFPTAVADGTGYDVTVSTQPMGPAQACEVTSGSGVAMSTVSNIEVDCSSNWTWESGNALPNKAGTYGSLGSPASTNTPGARWAPASWTTPSGDFWLFSGSGYDAGGNLALAPNDLWKYSAGQWTWTGGATAGNQIGVYGTLGVASPTNVPGSRDFAATWTDKSGNLWLYGGLGADSVSASSGALSDLWEYSNGQWTWVSGSNRSDQPGTYGTLGTPAAANTPGQRFDPAHWVDAAGNFYLFGGYDYSLNLYNDLWKFDGAQWTWLGGTDLTGQYGVYGTLGSADPANIPGGRAGAATWVAANGDVYLFGGFGYGIVVTDPNLYGALNDLWKLSGGVWTWIGGSTGPSSIGTYGTRGVAAATNQPGSRSDAATWTDASGALWLFGGDGRGTTPDFGGPLDDLWKYDSGQWTWVNGSHVDEERGIYQSVGAVGMPGGRAGPAFWTDISGDFWLFGGIYSYQDSNLASDYLGDLWQYKPDK